MRYLSRFVVACVVAALAMPMLSFAQDKDEPETFVYELKYKKGDKVRYKQTSSGMRTVTVPGFLDKPTDVGLETTIVYSEEVKSVSPDGSFTLVTQYENGVIVAPKIWVWEDADATIDDKSYSLSKAELPRVEYVVNKYGEEVKRFELPDTVATQMQSSMGFQANWSVMDISPKRPVFVGEEWKTKESQAEGKFSFARFEDVEGERCAMIFLTVRMKGDIPAEAGASFAGHAEITYDGTAWVRVTDCRIVKAEITVEEVTDGKLTQNIASDAAGVFLKAGQPFKEVESNTINLNIIRLAKKPGKPAGK